MEKSKRKEILKAIKEKELAKFRQNLPMSEDKFIQLFEILDDELHAHGCDHDLKLTEQILSNLGIKDVLSVLQPILFFKFYFAALIFSNNLGDLNFNV